jgi:hypothetical protein
LLLLAKDPENSNPVPLDGKIHVAIFTKPFFQGVSYGVLGLLSFGSQS